MEIEIINHPEKKQDTKTDEKVKKITDERNKIITQKLNIDKENIKVNLYYDAGQVASKVGNTSDNHLGVFCGYVDYESEIHIANPKAIEPIFSENLTKQLFVMTDYCLYKLYLCKKYFPKDKPYKLYYKYLTEGIAKILSGYYNKDTIIYEIRHFNELKKYKKDMLIMMTLFVIIEKSDISMIYDNLNELYEKCDIEKSIFKIYKKSSKDLIELYKKDMELKEKELKKVK